MESLITIIAVIAIIYGAVKKQGTKRPGQQNPGAGRNPGQPQRQNMGYNPRSQGQNQNQRNPQAQNVNYGRTQADNSAAMAGKQQELKQNLLQRYGRTQQNSAPGTITGAKENEKNQLRQDSGMRKNPVMPETLASAKAPVAEVFYQPKSELMEQVDNLIIMGYQTDFTFERDFVGEGIEMLNQFGDEMYGM